MIIRLVLAAALLSTACGQSSGKKETPRNSSSGGEKKEQNTTKTEGSKEQSPQPTAGTPEMRDLLVITAIGDETPSQAGALKAGVSGLLSALAKKFSGSDMKLGLIASTSAAISGVSVSLNAADGFTAANSQQLNFELSPKDVFIGTLVSGCAATDSNLDATHAAGTVKVCGQQVAVPSHSWTWGVQDLQGKLQSFLRPGSVRTYIFVASNDVGIVSASEFIKIAGAQNSGKSPQVFAIAPTQSGGICSDKNKKAALIEEAVGLAAGKTYSYCQADWTPHINDLVQTIK